MTNITLEAHAIIAIKCAGLWRANEYENKSVPETITHFAISKIASALLEAHNIDIACKHTKRTNVTVPIVIGRLFFRYFLPNINAIKRAVAEKVKRTILDMSAKCDEKLNVAKHTINPKTKR